MRFALLCLISACVSGEVRSNDITVSFGTSTELLTVGEFSRDGVSMNVVRNCFGAHYNGIQMVVIVENILTVDRDLDAIKVSDVFVDTSRQVLYEIVELRSQREFIVHVIDPLAVFTKIKLNSMMLSDPNNFEGFVNVEFSGLSFIVIEYDVTTQEDTSFTYNSRNTTLVPTKSDHIFTLTVDIIGYTIGLTVDVNRGVLVNEKVNSITSGGIQYTRAWYHETHLSGVLTSSDINATEYVTENSFPKPFIVSYDDIESTIGYAQCQAIFHTEVVFEFSIGRDQGSLVAMTDYIIDNEFTLSGGNNYIDYRYGMTCSKYVTEFAINNRIVLPAAHVNERAVELGHADERTELIYSEEMNEPRARLIRDDDSRTIMYPKVLKSNKGHNLTIRFDAIVDGHVVNVLMLEPMKFNGSAIDQPRTMMLEYDPSSYTFKTFVRDMDKLTGKYITQTFNALESSLTIYEAEYNLTIEIEFSKATRIDTGEFYYNRGTEFKYVYFEPVELGDGYSVMKRQHKKFVANSVDEKFHHEAIVSKRDRTIFWNDMVFDLKFVNLSMNESVEKLTLSFYIQESHVKVQTLYETTFTSLSEVDSFDRIMFQMNETCSLTVYAFIQRKIGDEEALFKYSYKQMTDKIDKTLEYDLEGCKIVLDVGSKSLEPVLPISDLVKFAVVPVFSSDEVIFRRDESYAIHQRVYSTVSKVETWPSLRAVMKNVNLTILSQYYVADGDALVVDLIPNVNIRNEQMSVTQNIPVFAHFAGIYSCVSEVMFAIDDNVGMFCRKSADITGNSSFYLGCLQYGTANNLMAWKPNKLDFTPKTYQVGPHMTATTIRINSKTTETVYCALENVHEFPVVSTVLHGNFNDTRFNSFRIKCNRCDQLTNGKMYKDPDVGTNNIWTLDKALLSVPFYATCKKQDDPYCIKSMTFNQLTLAEYGKDWGLETYTENVSLESGVKAQILQEGTIKYAKKWNGTIKTVDISKATKLSMEIEITRDQTVYLRAYADARHIPFSSVAAFKDPLKFMKELGVGFGNFNTDGTISCQPGAYSQPSLGIFNVTNYTEMDLDFLYGFSTTAFDTFEIRCAENSPEENGLCTRDSSTVPPSTMLSITSDISLSPESKNYTLMIVTLSTGSLVLVLGVAAIFLIYKRKRQFDVSESDICSQKMLEECDFSV